MRTFEKQIESAIESYPEEAVAEYWSGMAIGERSHYTAIAAKDGITAAVEELRRHASDFAMGDEDSD